MKKLLLSLATVALTGAFAMADNVTVNFSDETAAASLPTAESATPSTAKISGIDFEFMNCKKGSYNGVYLQISAKSVTPMGYVAFTLPDNCTKFTITTGGNASKKVTVSLTAGSKTIKENVVLNQTGSDFAFEIPADYQDAGTKYTLQVTNKYNAQITKIVFETEQGGSSTLTPAGLSFPESQYTVVMGEEFTAPALTKATDAAATYTSSNEEVATVDAATGAVTILAAGTTVIKAATPATATYKAGEASYTLKVVAAYNSIAEVYAAEGVSGIINFPLAVAYQNGSSTYALDDAGNYTLIYGTNVGTRERGDIIPAGWEGKYSPYNGLPEIVPVTTPAESTDHIDYTPVEVESVNADMMNYVVVLKKVTFAADTPAGRSNFEGTAEDGTEYTFRNNFLLETVVAGTYNVELAVSTYGDALQLYPTKYTTWESGVNEITVAEGEAQYFNMQGVRVANPENGMFIRIQNGKAQKVVIK